MRLFTRSIRPPDEIVPNPNDPASVPPATVGPPSARAGDPHGVVVEEGPPPPPFVPLSRPVPWSGWPSDWWTPGWNSHLSRLTDTAWAAMDLNTSALASMPPYLIDAAPTLDSDWLRNPDPDLYSSWDEFAASLFWDFYLGEAFVLATARYASGWPARFHVVPPWSVNIEIEGGQRSYSIGRVPLSTGPGGDLLHLRYQGSVDDAHGHGPLEAGATKLIAAEILNRYGAGLAQAGGIPPSILVSDDWITDDQADGMKQRWIEARQAGLGEPAVLSGGLKWSPTQVNAKDMALVELLQFNESRIAVMLGVPPHLLALPAGGDSMTYANVTAYYEQHWRSGLRPRAAKVTNGLSQWLTPRGTTLRLNQDEYIRPEPLQRAQTEQIYANMGVLSVEEIRRAEHFSSDTRIEGVPQ